MLALFLLRIDFASRHRLVLLVKIKIIYYFKIEFIERIINSLTLLLIGASASIFLIDSTFSWRRFFSSGDSSGVYLE